MTKLIVLLNDICVMINLHFFHHCINMRNVMINIPNYMCLLRTKDIGSTTLMLRTIPIIMILSTYPTLKWCCTIAYSLLLSMYLINCIELVLMNHNFFRTFTLRSSLLWLKFSFNFLISFEVMLRINFSLRLLIKMFQLLDGLFQWSRLIKLNPVYGWCS